MASRRRLRLVAPVAVVGLIALGSWIPTLSSASASPRLPAISPEALVAKAETADVRHFSGTVRWRADLGLPSLAGVTGGGQGPDTASAFDPSELLSGTHDIDVAVGGAGELRLSAASPLAETDLVVNGHQAWISESSTGHVQHLVAPAPRHPARPGRVDWTDTPTPAAVAARVLAHLRSGGTVVTTSSPVMVADRPAYQLRLVPDRAQAASSTVSAIVISVDATTGMVLAVAVDAVGQASPALWVGLTSLSYGAPPASDFAPLHGITESTTTVHGWAAHGWAGRGRSGAWADATWSGSGWDAVLSIPASHSGSLVGRHSSAILSLTTPVAGPWGSGRLLRSSLLDALLLPDGRVLVGFVTPAVLERAAGR